MIYFPKKYYSFNQSMRENFDTKIVKLSLDGGFTCPNRDGTLDNRGCIFCSAKGSGDFTFSTLSINQQLEKQIELTSKKWSDAKYIAYFQNYTNTYKKSLTELKNLYETALNYKYVVGLAIGTRPDCIADDVLDLLAEINKKTFLFVELGLQTIHKKSSKYLRLYYDVDNFNKAVAKLNLRGIKCVAHTILGLPNENRQMIIETVEHLNSLPVWGIKLQMLNVLSGTDLEKGYADGKFTLYSKEDYVSFICDIIEHLRGDIVIHRLTGDGAKDILIALKWIINKRDVLNSIDKELTKRNTFQGKLFGQAW